MVYRRKTEILYDFENLFGEEIGSLISEMHQNNLQSFIDNFKFCICNDGLSVVLIV